jgi:ketosteroid isomerase-like protein
MSTTSSSYSSIAEREVEDAITSARLFLEALNARDLHGLEKLVADDVEFRKASGGPSLHGRDALEALLTAAADADLRLARIDSEQVTATAEVIRLEVPVIELVRGSQIRGTALFEVRDGKIAAFEVSSELLRR